MTQTEQLQGAAEASNEPHSTVQSQEPRTWRHLVTADLPALLVVGVVSIALRQLLVVGALVFGYLVSSSLLRAFRRSDGRGLGAALGALFRTVVLLAVVVGAGMWVGVGGLVQLAEVSETADRYLQGDAWPATVALAVVIGVAVAYMLFPHEDRFALLGRAVGRLRAAPWPLLVGVWMVAIGAIAHTWSNPPAEEDLQLTALAEALGVATDPVEDEAADSTASGRSGPTFEVAGDEVNLRGGPAVEHAAVTSLGDGAALGPVLETRDGADGHTWMLFDLEEGVEGWIRADLVREAT